MDRHKLPTHEFFNTLWKFFVLAILSGFLSLFNLFFGLLFCCGATRPKNGTPGIIAGIALCVIGVFFFTPFSLSVYKIITRSRPALGIYREGLKFQYIRPIKISVFPLYFFLIQIMWFIATGPFRLQSYLMPWKFITDIHVSGLPMAKRMIITGCAFRCGGNTTLKEMTFSGDYFATSLDQIAGTIQAFASDPRIHEYLPSWGNYNIDMNVALEIEQHTQPSNR